MPVNKSMCSNIINHLDIQSHRFDPAPIKRQMVSLKKAAFHHQRGVSLFIVLIILLLSLIVVLGGLQVANLNESIVGNESDAQRAYGAAEALLDAAQRDIRRNGRDCNAPALGQTGTNSSLRAGTPAAAIACTLRYPRDTVDYMQMLTRNDIIGGIGKCSMNATYGGVCIANGPTDGKFRIDKVNNGQTTGAEQFNNGISYNNNFINTQGDANWGGNAYAGSGATAVNLALETGNFNGRYWVEIFPYNVMGTALKGTSNIPVPDGTYPFVFRITALVKGLRGGTASVLRTYYIPYPMATIK